jgi:hypothetical protein
MRPGGGMQEQALSEAQRFQREENAEILHNAGGAGVRMHQMEHSEDPRKTYQLQLQGKREPPLKVGMRQFPVQFQKLTMLDEKETLESGGFHKSQEDSGAGMHLHNNLDDYVLGYTTKFSIFAGSADSSKDLVKLSAVGPLIRVFYGVDSQGNEVRTIRNIGPAGAISEGNWASLTSHDGIVRERVDDHGGERVLDNNFDAQRQLLIFDASSATNRIEIKMTRKNGGSYLESRRPSALEHEAYLEAYPSMRK